MGPHNVTSTHFERVGVHFGPSYVDTAMNSQKVTCAHLETVGVLIFSAAVSGGCLCVSERGERLAYFPACRDVMKCEENKSRCENAAFLSSVCLCRQESGIQNSTFNFRHTVEIVCRVHINLLANMKLRLELAKTTYQTIQT